MFLLTNQIRLVNFQRIVFAGFSHPWRKTERKLLFVLSWLSKLSSFPKDNLDNLDNLDNIIKSVLNVVSPNGWYPVFLTE